MHSEINVVPIYPLVNVKDCVDWMTASADIKPHYAQLNSDSSHATFSDEDSIASRSSEPSEAVNNQK